MLLGRSGGALSHRRRGLFWRLNKSKLWLGRLCASQGPEPHAGYPRYVRLIVAVRIAQIIGQSFVLQVTADCDIGGPNTNQNRAIKRHDGREPHESQKT